MYRERQWKSVLGMMVLGTIALMGCETDTQAPKPIPPESYTVPLEIRAHCTVWYALEDGGLDMSEGLVLPNGACTDHSEKGDATVGPPPDPTVVVLSIRNPRTVPVTLTSILLETVPPVSSPQRDLTELVEFRPRYAECLERLSNPPSGGGGGGVLGSVSFIPKILQPGEKCFTELGLINRTGTSTSTTTGFVLFFDSSTELARIPISVSY